VAEQSDFERDLRLLESTIHQLESQYNMFFAGSLPKPPLEARSRVEALFRRYDRTYIQSYADRFRLGALQTRFTRFCELWDRGIRAREEGRPGPFQHLRRDDLPDGARSAPAPPDAPSAPAEHAVRVSLGREADLAAKIEGLYAALVEARHAAGSRDELPFDRFTDLVQGQIARLRKAGSREVVFRVATQDGKVSFTARASASGAMPATGDRPDDEPRKQSGK
jgi:hypothetical protein